METPMDLSKCRDACAESAMLCVQAATHYLVKGDENLRDIVRLLWDCSDACDVTARFLNRGSPAIERCAGLRHHQFSLRRRQRKNRRSDYGKMR